MKASFTKLLKIALGATVATSFLWLHSTPYIGRTFTPDSYAMALLGRTFIGGEGYATTGVRDNRASPEWPVLSRSFPPIYPMAIGLIDYITHSGIFSGIILNFICLFLTVVLITSIFTESWVAQTLAILALPVFYATSEHFILETTAARTMPVTVFFFTLAIFAFQKATTRKVAKYFALFGLALSGLCLTRFDHFLPALAGLFVVSTLHPRRAPFAWIVFLAFLSPWVWYGFKFWGTAFPSDSSIMTLTLNPKAMVGDFFPVGASMPTMSDDPMLWLNQRINFFLRNWRTFFSIFHWQIWVLIGLSLVSVIHSRNWKTLGIYAGVLAYAVILIGTISLTPYPDDRYFTPIVYASTLSALWSIRDVRLQYISIALIIGTLAMNFSSGESRDVEVERQYFKTAHAILLKNGFRDGDTVGVGDPMGFIPPEMFSYFTGDHCVMLPPNLPPGTPGFSEWQKKWNIKWLFLTQDFVKQYAAQLGSPRFDPVPGSSYVIFNFAK